MIDESQQALDLLEKYNTPEHAKFLLSAFNKEFIPIILETSKKNEEISVELLRGYSNLLEKAMDYNSFEKAAKFYTELAKDPYWGKAATIELLIDMEPHIENLSPYGPETIAKIYDQCLSVAEKNKFAGYLLFLESQLFMEESNYEHFEKVAENVKKSLNTNNSWEPACDYIRIEAKSIAANSNRMIH